MSFSSLKGRNVIVTGGGRGLGKVMALALVQAGANVTVTGAKSPAQLDETVAEALALGAGGCQGVLADVADPESCARAVETARTTFGEVDVLINNAARGSRELYPGLAFGAKPPFWTADVAAYAELLLTNIAGPFLMTRCVVEGMIARKFGRIVNISTSRPTMVNQSAGTYGPSKTALEANSLIWARQLEGTGVTVNVLVPGGATDTALIPGDNVGGRAVPWRPELGPEAEGFVKGLLPPAVMVAPALWLASNESAAFTGRRFVGRNWNPALSPEDAIKDAMAPTIDWPHII
jgi:3-oxoacyl-[acyl-carrier protein] reductase